MSDNLDSHIDIPGPVIAIGRRITDAGGELHIVGGWVRDYLRGEECKDIDLATSLSANRVRQALSGLGSVYALGEQFGTIGLQMEDYTLEITTFRRDEYSHGSRHPRISKVREIEEDLSRRDFTINAIALSAAPEQGVLIDPFDGKRDIEQRLIRTPGPPAPRMTEDPLRMLRAVRFAAQLGYDIVPELKEAIEAKPGLLDTISQERRRDELEKIIISPGSGRGVRMLVGNGLMEYVAPEVSAMAEVEQPPAYHRANVLEHTLLMMDYLAPVPLLRRAALFHDVGKPPAKVTEPKTMFPEHEKIGESLTRSALRRLRYSNEDIQKTVFLVRYHMRPIHYRSNWSDAAVRRLIRDCILLKDNEILVPLESVMELARADILAGSFETVEPNIALVEELEQRVERIQAEQKVESVRSPLDGRELMELSGREQGPWIKAVKDYLTELVLDGVLDANDKEAASRFARELLES